MVLLVETFCLRVSHLLFTTSRLDWTILQIPHNLALLKNHNIIILYISKIIRMFYKWQTYFQRSFFSIHIFQFHCSCKNTLKIQMKYEIKSNKTFGFCGFGKKIDLWLMLWDLRLKWLVPISMITKGRSWCNFKSSSCERKYKKNIRFPVIFICINSQDTINTPLIFSHKVYKIDYVER